MSSRQNDGPDARFQQFLERPALHLIAASMAREEAEAPAISQVGPYRVDLHLGSGGMGVVYKARDTRLDRDVALKFLPRQLIQDPQAMKRFQREARAVSALNHPNICSLHDIGEHEGQPYLVMELLEGQTLKDRLAQGPLSQKELLTVALQMTDALHAAHSKRIVHRDIKPANVFLTRGGLVKILDFGLAKPVSEPASVPVNRGESHSKPADETLSQSGVFLGTAPYMSPEQIRGEPVDARSDLFSLGVMLCLAATGVLPFRGGTRSEIAQAILAGEPTPPRKITPRLPRQLERLLLKALMKEPERRYQSALEFQSALIRWRDSGRRRTWWAAAAACIVALVILFAIGPWRPAPGRSLKRVAVLPLQNLSGSSEQDHLADGITDAIAGDLARIEGLRVISRTSAMQYKGTQKTAPEIARELNVDALLEGSVAGTPQRVQVRVQLTQAKTSRVLWAESFSLDLRDIRKVQSQMAREVARSFGLRLSPEDEARLAKTGTVNRDAFEAYLRGRHYWAKRIDTDIQRAVGYFRAAIDADPAYGAAYAALADCYNQLATVMVGQPTGENRALAIASAKRALEIDDQLAEAHAALGFASMYNWDWAAAELELGRALDLNPSYASARIWHGTYLSIRHRFAEAIAEAERARDLDPLSLITQTQVGWIYKFAGRDEDAITQYRKVLAVDPDFSYALSHLGGSLMDTGKAGEAVQVLERAVRISRNNPSMLGALGQAYAMSGRRPEAIQVLARLQRMSKERYVTPVAGLYVCLGLDDRDCFFNHLEEAYRQRANFVALLSVLPSPRRFGALRADPRFQDMLRRLQ